MKRAIPALLLSLSACSMQPAEPSGNDVSPAQEQTVPARADTPAAPAPAPAATRPPVRETVSEAPFTPTSAQGAANVVQTYFALLEA